MFQSYKRLRNGKGKGKRKRKGKLTPDCKPQQSLAPIQWIQWMQWAIVRQKSGFCYQLVLLNSMLRTRYRALCADIFIHKPCTTDTTSMGWTDPRYLWCTCTLCDSCWLLIEMVASRQVTLMLR